MISLTNLQRYGVDPAFRAEIAAERAQIERSFWSTHGSRVRAEQERRWREEGDLPENGLAA